MKGKREDCEPQKTIVVRAVLCSASLRHYVASATTVASATRSTRSAIPTITTATAPHTPTSNALVSKSSSRLTLRLLKKANS